MIATAPATCMAESTARIDSNAATRIPRMENNFTSSATRGLCLKEVTGLAEAGRVRNLSASCIVVEWLDIHCEPVGELYRGCVLPESPVIV